MPHQNNKMRNFLPEPDFITPLVSEANKISAP
jgi:hypothetical protein